MFKLLLMNTSSQFLIDINKTVPATDLKSNRQNTKGKGLDKN